MSRTDKKSGVVVLMIFIFLTVMFVLISGTYYFAERQYNILQNLSQKLINKYPENEVYIIRIIKETIENTRDNHWKQSSYLTKYGFQKNKFLRGYFGEITIFLILAFLVNLFLIYLLVRSVKKRNNDKIAALTKYLEGMNMGREVLLSQNREDTYGALEDEIYKTVKSLKNTREEALLAKDNYADNLANIAHQMKTPLTSVLLLLQMISEDMSNETADRIRAQVERLVKLEDSLLLISRIDAGVLRLDHSDVDVYTMLHLVLEGLEEKMVSEGIEIKLIDSGAVSYTGDIEWSIEAFSNIIKNCLEYAKKQVIIEYTQNPIYTEIKVCDDGNGFLHSDMYHIFERFYRGNRSKEGGIGIGLSLAKSLILMQNGCIEAKNQPNSGACFIVRFYCHQNVTFH